MILPAHKDPMGKAIADYWQHKKADILWVDSDITERDQIPVFYLFRTFDEMPAIEQKALELCKGKVLDVGAASGLHSLYLKEKGFAVKPIDISTLAVNTMKSRGLENAQAIDFYDITKPAKYDTLLFLMNGIGIAENLAGLNRFLQKAKDLLNPGGQIVLDSSDLAYMYDQDFPKPDDRYYGEVNYIMQYGSVISEPFGWLFIHYDLLKQHAKNLGLSCEKVKVGSHSDYLAKLTVI